MTTIESSSQEGFRLIIGFSFIPFNRKASKCLKTLKFILTVFSPVLSLTLNRPMDGREGGVCALPSFVLAPFVYTQSPGPSLEHHGYAGKGSVPLMGPTEHRPKEVSDFG